MSPGSGVREPSPLSYRLTAVTKTRSLPAVAAGLVLAIAGCAHSTGTPVVNPVWHSCAADRDPNGGGTDALPRLDASFAPVAAVICRTVDQKRPGGGTDQLAVEDRATDVTALVTALRLPDGKHTDGGCTLDLVVPPWLVLLDAQSRWIRPGVPIDGCHHPRREVLNAISALHTTRVSSHLLRTVISDGAAASGCGQDYSDMAWAQLRNDPTRTAAPTAVPTPAAPVKVCIFRVPASERGGPKPGADYESNLTLTPQQWDAVEHELTHAGPPAPCRTSASRIAVLDDGTVAELDGCRLVRIGGMVRQGTPALAALLDRKGR